MKTQKILSLAVSAVMTVSAAALTALPVSAWDMVDSKTIKKHSVGITGSFSDWGLGNKKDVVMTEKKGVWTGVIDIPEVTDEMVTEAYMDDGSGDRIYRGMKGINFKVRLDNGWEYSWGEYEPAYDRTYNSQTNCCVPVKVGSHVKITVTLDTTKNDPAALLNPDSDADANEVDSFYWPVRYSVTEYKGNTPLTPTPVTSVKLDKTQLNFNINKNGYYNGVGKLLTATVLPDSATNKLLTWSSSNYKVAYVHNGLVIPYGAGTATITAKSSNGKTAACKVVVTQKDIPVEKIEIEPKNLTLETYDLYVLKANFTPEDATEAQISWSSSNSKIVSVYNEYNNYCEINAVGEGTATITATTSNGKKATCKVTVKPYVPVKSVKLDKTSVTIEAGKTTNVKATISPSDATFPYISWYTDNGDVATVDEGKITAVSEGTATITAQVNDGKSATCKVTVTKPKTTIKMVKTSYNMGVGESYTLKTTITPENATDKNIVWSSSDTSIATVSEGKVTTKKTGIVYITAALSNGKSASCKVTVLKAPNKVTLDKSAATIGVGEKFSIKTSLPSGTAATPTFTSSNSSVVQITDTGSICKFVGLKPGTANIEVKLYNGIVGLCRVTVKAEPTSVSMPVTSLTLGVGEKYSLNAALSKNSGSGTKSYSSSNSSVVKITKSSGICEFKAVKEGTSNVTVRLYNGLTATCAVTVKAAPKSVSFGKDSLTMKVGENTVLTPVLEEDQASSMRLYGTSDASVVRISRNKDGSVQLKAIKAGTADISVTLYNGKEAKCKVTVK